MEKFKLSVELSAVHHCTHCKALSWHTQEKNTWSTRYWRALGGAGVKKEIMV